MQFDGVEKYLLLQKLKWTSFWFFRFFKFDILKGKNTPVTRAKLRRFFGPIVAKIINTFSGKNIYHKTSLDWGFLLFKLFKTALVFPKKNYKNVLINFIQMRTRIDKNVDVFSKFQVCWKQQKIWLHNAAVGTLSFFCCIQIWKNVVRNI
jgi:hypothetical protein